MVLGVTGNIACGKSTVAAIFAELGTPVVSADQLARQVVEPGSPVLERLVERFGGRILTEDGRLDRVRLGELVFADETARLDLNRIIHPAIARVAEERLADLRNAGHRLIVYEAALLFEAGARNRVDRVLVVTVAPEIQLQRLMDRDGLSAEAARRRIGAQLPQADKVARADYRIDNSGSLEATRKQVRDLWQGLTAAPG